MAQVYEMIFGILYFYHLSTNYIMDHDKWYDLNGESWGNPMNSPRFGFRVVLVKTRAFWKAGRFVLRPGMVWPTSDGFQDLFHIQWISMVKNHVAWESIGFLSMFLGKSISWNPCFVEIFLLFLFFNRSFRTWTFQSSFEHVLTCNFKNRQPFHNSGAEQHQGCTEHV